jgi:site-specific DNA recombinase
MATAKDQTRVALYARVSSEQQADAGTIASQVAELRERISRDGFRLEDEACFLDDGCSGTTLLRPALERLRDQVANGAVDRLYVHSPDRLARKYAYQVLLVDELTRGGVEVVFLNRALGRSPEDDLLLQVQGIMAEYERAKIIERSRRGKLHAARRGSVNVLCGAPYGYRYVTIQEGGGAARYEVVWEEARVVQQIFAWVGQERVSLAEVSRRLHRQGVPTRTGKERWDRSALAYLLQNPAYKGQAGFGKRRFGAPQARLRPRRGGTGRRSYSVYRNDAGAIPIAVPALVSEPLFAAAAEQLAENRRRYRQAQRGPQHLLQGLLVCPRCGYALCGQPRYVRSGRGFKPAGYSYYRCTGAMRKADNGERLCSNRAVRSDDLETAVWQDVCQLLQDPGKIEAEYERRLRGQEAARDRTVGGSLGQRVRHVKRGIARLIDAYEEGLLDKEEFEPRLRGAKERLARLEAEAEQCEHEEEQRAELRLVIGKLQEFAARVAEGLAEADWPARREIIRCLVKRIEVDDEQVRIVYRIGPVPFVEAPAGGILQDCWKRADPFSVACYWYCTPAQAGKPRQGPAARLWAPGQLDRHETAIGDTKMARRPGTER